MSSFTDPDGAPRFCFEIRKANDIAWVILQGEADVATLEALEAALDHAELNGAQSIHLHVKDLQFVDSTTVRRLTVFAKGAKQAGHDVKTCGANRTFHLLARLLGVRNDLGLL
jgi:anti-anti-sigma factor